MEASNQTPKKSPKDAAKDRLRFALAIGLSALVLLGAPMILKRYFPSAPPPPPVTTPEERTGNQTPKAPEPKSVPAPTAGSPTGPRGASPAGSSNASQVAATNAAPREVLVQTRFWSVKLSNRGGVATSWILKKVPGADGSLKDIFAANGGPLELVAQHVLENLGAPLRVRTPWTPELASVLNQSYFEVQGDSGTGIVNVEGGEPRTITFTYSAGDIVARKSYTFYGERFIFDANVEIKRGGEVQPVQLAFGPHFGDQTDTQHGSYSTPPQAVACSID